MSGNLFTIYPIYKRVSLEMFNIRWLYLKPYNFVKFGGIQYSALSVFK